MLIFWLRGVSLNKMRFQTGDIDLIINSLKEKGTAQVDIDAEQELPVLISDLEQKGMAVFGELDAAALDLLTNPEFYGRHNVMVDKISGALDIFLIEQEEKGYDEIFWG